MREQKKILILGGASVHCKLVECAKAMDLYTIVTDYLEDSPAKKIADESWMLNITDIDGIVERCRKNKVDAVISTHLDPCQRPYQMICEKLDLPCYGTREQFFQMTDKQAFKKMCQQNQVDVIQEFFEHDIYEETIEYPVFIKPVDSRGSRGQSVCCKKDEAIKAIEAAKRESSNGQVIIEKYMRSAEEIQVTYFFVNGTPYLIRMADSYKGLESEGLEKVVICAVSPSKYTDQYMEEAHEKVISMFKKLGIKNGPIFMQGFYDGQKFRFFDPGLRFPGVDYDRIYKDEFGIDIIRMMITYALNGRFDETELPADLVKLKGKKIAILFPTISSGKIQAICGEEKIKENEHVFSYLPRHTKGEVIDWTYDVNQRVAEIDVIAEDKQELISAIKEIQRTLKVDSDVGNSMIYGPFDTEKLQNIDKV